MQRLQRSERPTNDCSITDWTFDSSPPPPTLRSRYLLRAEKGYLCASHSIEGPPIVVSPTPANATRFVDFVTAVRRARALHELGWRHLRIVELRVP